MKNVQYTAFTCIQDDSAPPLSQPSIIIEHVLLSALL
jgi:hypothetical protein